MLKKLTPLNVPADNPFANDTLDRQQSAVRLTKLIESTEQPFVLSVEAPWGWGKTTFIQMWKAHLEKNGHVCLHFNAWENDFVEDPLIGFLGEMNAHLAKRNAEGKGRFQQSLDAIKQAGGHLIRKGIPAGLEALTKGALKEEHVKQVAGALSGSAEEIAKIAGDFAKERIEKYEEEKKGIKAFRANLEKLAQELVTEEDRKSPLVFFIDELDRCRPDFAVALLERIKHLFNVPRVVFVLSVDRNQLNQSVKALYGLEMDPDGYLRRFIDLAFSLPAPSNNAFACNLYNHFALNEVRFPCESLIESFSNFATAFQLSLRTQEQCFTEINSSLGQILTIVRRQCQSPYL